MTMTIARWKISVQHTTDATTNAASYGDGTFQPSAVERAAQQRNIQRNYEQQRENTFRWQQLNGTR